MFKERKNNLINFFLIGLGVFFVFAFGFWLGKNQVVCPYCQPEDFNFSLFWETLHELQDKYVDKTKIDYQKILYGAIEGMVKSLQDPYTVFLPPEEAKRFEEDVKGSFEGVGMEIGMRKGQLEVISPLEGTPAQRAGLRPGDKIMKINDVFTNDLTIDEAVNLIRGPKGTEVSLTILRSDWQEPKEIKIVRDVILVPSLKWEIKDDDIVYIKIYQFSEKLSNDFPLAAMEILKTPAKKIILDLRNNPGGYLEVAQEIAGWFLKEGEVVVIEDRGKDEDKIVHRAEGNARFLSYPIVVLINNGSASASEILAGCLRDNRKVLLIGEKSFGKGSVQQLVELTDKSSLKITIATWLTPSGNVLTDKGLEPDIKVEMTSQDYDEGKDPQLDKALEVIKEMR